jgi:O-antigen/teichoic acid export membrane protein
VEGTTTALEAAVDRPAERDSVSERATSQLGRVLGNAALLTGFRFIADIVFIVFYIALLRRYGSEGLGVYAFTIATTSAICGVPQLALARFLTRDGSASDAAYGALWRPVMRSSVAASALAALVVAVVALWLPPELRLPLLIMGAGQVCYSQAEVFRAAFAVHERLGRIAHAELIYKTVVLVIGLPLMLSGAPLVATLSVFPLAGLVYLVLVAVASRRYRPQVFTDSPPLALTLKGAAAFLTTALVEVPIYRQQTIWLALSVGVAASGSYAAAFKLVDAGLLGIGFLNGALLPALTRSHFGRQSGYHALVWRTGAMLIAGTGAVALAVVLLAPWIIALIYGDELADAAPVLALLAPVLIVGGLRQLLLTAINAAGRSWRWAAAQGVTAVAGAVACFVFVPQFGAIGGAAALLVSESVGGLAALFVYFDIRRSAVQPAQP